MTLEKKLEARLRDDIKKLGGVALKMYCLSFTGVPDRLILMPRARVFWVELKSEYKKPTPRQSLVHKMLRNLGFDVRFINSEDGYAGLIRDVKSES